MSTDLRSNIPGIPLDLPLSVPVFTLQALKFINLFSWLCNRYMTI